MSDQTDEPDFPLDDSEFSLRDGFRPFRGQNWRTQIAAVGGSVAVWVAAYALVLTVLGDGLATAESLGAIDARRNAAAVAGATTGAYFGALWTRGRGGPLLNVFYLVGVQVIVPARVYALGGTPPEHLISEAESALFLLFADPAWLLDHAVMVIPGPVAFGLALAVWGQSLTPEDQRAFVETYFPESWLRLREA